MKIIKYALLLSGLFFSSFLLAQDELGTCSTGVAVAGVGCTVNAPSGQLYYATTVYNDNSKTFTDKDEKTAEFKACGWFLGVTSGATSAGERQCTSGRSYKFKECNWTTRPDGSGYCDFSGSWRYSTIPGSTYLGALDFYCPPDDPRFKSFTNLRKINATSAYCFKSFDPRPPLDCSALKGVGSSMTNDYFITDPAAGYTQENPPSCVTKTAKDEQGNQRSGDCKVVAGRWGQLNTPQGVKWWPLAGTFTGAACGETESAKPDPNPPKCWETKNGLDMCIEDPAEKCQTINGVQQCQAGCGYVNGDFYCKAKDNAKPDPNEKDKPIQDADDTITDPNKPIDQMLKSDFKNVQKGVETRVGQVVTGIGNLENSVDGLGNKLDDISDKLDDSNGTLETSNNLLKGIKDGIDKIVGSPTDGDGDGEPDGECDPLTDKDCGEAGGAKSWWNSPYPEGFSGMVSENMDDFLQSKTYQSLTTQITISGGTAPNLNFCLNFGFADFGCHNLDLPPFIWNFIKACFLFYAAIVARRLLIGA